MLAPLVPLASHVVATAADHPRALARRGLAQAARRLGAQAEEAPSVAAALRGHGAQAGLGGGILVTGSLRTVGEAMADFGDRAADD